MTDFPLSKEEQSMISEILNQLHGDSPIQISETNYQRWLDILQLMEERNLIALTHTPFGYYMRLDGDPDIFLHWIKEQNKKANQLSRRDYKLAITSGLLVFILTQLVNFLVYLLNKRGFL